MCVISQFCISLNLLLGRVVNYFKIINNSI